MNPNCPYRCILSSFSENDLVQFIGYYQFPGDPDNTYPWFRMVSEPEGMPFMLLEDWVDPA